MVPHNIAKRQKADELETGEEAVLFNTDTLSKIISYLPSIDALSLALTCKRFGISDDDKKSVIKMSADILVHEIATEEQLAALPRYGGENALADYHYLQLMREPLTFDHLVNAEYVNSVDKSCIGNSKCYWTTESSTNILRAGKHYALFTSLGDDLMMGVMRPGKPNQRSAGLAFRRDFYQNFSRRMCHGEHNNNDNNQVHCCMYNADDGRCCFSNLRDSDEMEDWEGMESLSYGGTRNYLGGTIGMLLDLDEGALSVYRNGRKLGVMKRGLAGPYCWVVSLYQWAQVTIKRGTIPPT